MQIINLNDVQQFLKLMPYGDGGSGKTSLCASAGLDDRTAPVLHLDALGNPITIRKFNGYRGTVIRLTQLADLNPIYDWLYKGQPDNHILLDNALKAGTRIEPGYKTLCVDGSTKVQMLAFAQVLGRTPVVGQMLPGPEIVHYKQILIQMVNDIENIFNLPMHVIITALEDKEPVYTKPGKVMQKGDRMGEEEREGFYQYAPAIDGKSIRMVKAAAQTVFRITPVSIATPLQIAEAKALNNGKPPRWSISQFVQTRDVFAKDQHGFGVSFLGDVTVTKLLDLAGAK